MMQREGFSFEPASRVMVFHGNSSGQGNASPVANMVVRNTHPDLNVAYKIKTTTPKAYLVKPAGGILLSEQKGAAGASEQAGRSSHSIMVTANLEEVKGNTDKFLVQYVFTTDSTTLTKEQWNALAKDEVKEIKVGVDITELVASDKERDNGAGTASGSTTAASSTNVAETNRLRPNTQELSAAASGSVSALTNLNPNEVTLNELRSRYRELTAHTLSLARDKKSLEVKLMQISSASTSQRQNLIDVKSLIIHAFCIIPIMLLFMTLTSYFPVFNK